MAAQNNLMMIASADGSPQTEHAIASQVARYNQPKIKRSDFRDDFVFGAATSAYQIEGGWNAGSKGMSNWDVYTLKEPDLFSFSSLLNLLIGLEGGISDGSNGCVAIDNMFRISTLSLNSYRFSIAWSRILPGGRLCTGINKEGIKFYNDLIDALLAACIEPYVTIFHWDVPQCLEEEYGGFLSDIIVKDFCKFVEICFWEFGDRVKYWITLNEPWSFRKNMALFPLITVNIQQLQEEYVNGSFPPNHGKHPTTTGEATNLHKWIHLYIQESQVGKIGMTNYIQWYEPLTDSKEDHDLLLGDLILCWDEPLVIGDYPESMITNVGQRLLKFTEKEEKLVKGFYDFLGIKYYTASYATSDPTKPTADSYLTDSHILALRKY
ncbi:beta-glucosidase-like [Olea europaea subsp. europaea]|uniref:Beta-glucosidase-like n=1 Tax=Olea europaea subsp. europaea TaxID=158383 RepID=A0A8S0T4A7_OLEEU|nr:beta-glucosidase-like [Olea europaea subsp. europaea]